LFRVYLNPENKTRRRVFDTLEEFYNPVLNRSWEAATTTPLTVTALYNQWKCFVSKDVIQRIHQNNHAGSFQRFTWDWIERNTPDTDWWLLPFLNCNEGQWSSYYPSFWTGTGVPGGFIWESSSTQVYAGPGATPEEAYRKALIKARTEHEDFINTYGGQTGRDMYVSHRFSNARLLTHFQLFCLDRQFSWSTRRGRTEAHYKPSEIVANYPTATVCLDGYEGCSYYNAPAPISSTNRAPLYSVLSYSANVFDYFPNPIIMEDENNPTLFGVELEVSTDYTIRTLVDKCETPFFIGKQDSSISGSCDNEIELVTCPMSYNAQVYHWTKLLSSCDMEMFDTSRNTGNGMHIHCSPQVWTNEEHRKNFMWFFANPAHKHFLLTFSQRTEESFRGYSPTPEITTDDKQMAFTNVADFIRRSRGVVNLSNKGTLEVRLFKGIVSLADVVKNLTFVKTLIEFTKDKNYTEVTLKGYLNFLADNIEEEVELLKEFIEELDKEYCIAYSEVFEVVFTTRDPEKIAQKIWHDPIEMNDIHVTCLNMLLPTKPFKYKDKERPYKTKTHKGSYVDHKNAWMADVVVQKMSGKKSAEDASRPFSVGSTPTTRRTNSGTFTIPTRTTTQTFTLDDIISPPTVDWSYVNVPGPSGTITSL
jgi:hypothetical protein